MNKIYKVIWSKVTRSFVVVSELARNRSVSSRSAENKTQELTAFHFKPTAIAAILFSLSAGSAFAADATYDNVTVNNSLKVAGKTVATTDDVTNATADKAKKSDVDNLTDELTKVTDSLSKLSLDSGTYTGTKYFRINATGTDAKVNNSATNALAVGSKAHAKAKESVVIGTDAESNSQANNSVALGKSAQAGTKDAGDLIYDGASSVVVGDGKSVIAIGDGAISRGNENIAIGKGALTSNIDTGLTFATGSIAMGSNARTIASSNSVALGNGTTVTGSNGSIAFGNNSAVASEAHSSVAIGDTARTHSKNAVALGSNATASSLASIAIGDKSNAQQDNTVAIGSGAVALPYYTVSLGTAAGINQAYDDTLTYHSHINIGTQAGNSVKGQNNINIGTDAGTNTHGKNNVALGTLAGQNLVNNPESNSQNVAIGNQANSYGSATAIQRSTAVGSQTKAAQDASAFGYSAQALGNQATSVGYYAQTSGGSSTAVGANSKADAENVALGSHADATNLGTTLTKTSYLTGEVASSAVSVGNNSSLNAVSRRIINVADGAEDSDAATVAQLKQLSATVSADLSTQIKAVSSVTGIAYDALPRNASTNTVTLTKDGKDTIVGGVATGVLDTDAVNVAQLNKKVLENKTHFFSVNADTSAGNYLNTQAIGDNSLAIGPNVTAQHDRTVAIGNGAESYGAGSIALGTEYIGSAALDDGVAQQGRTTVNDKNGEYQYGIGIGAGVEVQGNNSLAIGSLASTTSKLTGGGNVDRAIAIGYSAGASSNHATAMGNNATASNDDATAIGSVAKALGHSSNAIGSNATASGTNAIAFGTNQVVDGDNSGSIGYAGVKGTDTATFIAGDGTYSLGNQNGSIEANESGVFGNNNKVKGVENLRVVGNTNLIGSSDDAAASSLKNVYVTGYDNKISSGAVQGGLKDNASLFVMGANNTIASAATEVKLGDAFVVGSNNTLNANGTEKLYVLGSNVTATQSNSVYLGDSSAYIANNTVSAGISDYSKTTVNGVEYTYAGGKPVGVVTVGKEDETRRIQGVASGLVAKTSTDAVNGSQLYSLTRPVGFAADNTKDLKNQDGEATATANFIQRSSGQAVEILGGATGALSDNNIGVNVKDNNTIEVKLAKAVSGMTSVTFANSTTPTATTTLSATSSGNLSVGGDQITNVKSGFIDTSGNAVALSQITGDMLTNVVNVGDLQSTVNRITAGSYGLKDEKGNYFVHSAGQPSQIIGDKNISTAIVRNYRNSGEDVLEVSLSDNIKLGGKTDSNDGALTVQSKDETKGVSLNGADGTIGIKGADGSSGNVTLAQGAAALGETANKTRLTYTPTGSTAAEEVATMNDGLSFAGNDGVATQRKLNSTLTIAGEGVDASASTNFASASGNINVKSTAAGKLEVQLANELKNLKKAEFKDGGNSTQISANEVALSNGAQTATISAVAGQDEGGRTINAVSVGGSQIKNVAAGVAGTDAVNVDQLRGMEGKLRDKMQQNRKRSDAGISGVAAMSNIPQVMLPGKSGVGIGAGTKNGQSAVALGYSRASDNGKHIIKLSSAYDSQGNFTGGAGYLYQW